MQQDVGSDGQQTSGLQSIGQSGGQQGGGHFGGQHGGGGHLIEQQDGGHFGKQQDGRGGHFGGQQSGGGHFGGHFGGGQQGGEGPQLKLESQHDGLQDGGHGGQQKSSSYEPDDRLLDVLLPGRLLLLFAFRLSTSCAGVVVRPLSSGGLATTLSMLSSIIITSTPSLDASRPLLTLKLLSANVTLTFLDDGLLLELRVS